MLMTAELLLRFKKKIKNRTEQRAYNNYLASRLDELYLWWPKPWANLGTALRQTLSVSSSRFDATRRLWPCEPSSSSAAPGEAVGWVACSAAETWRGAYRVECSNRPELFSERWIATIAAWGNKLMEEWERSPESQSQGSCATSPD
jgi:hypothetical protein